MRKQIQIFLLVLLAAAVPEAFIAQSQTAGATAVVEQGKFTLHKFEQPIGQDTYEITRDADSLAGEN